MLSILPSTLRLGTKGRMRSTAHARRRTADGPYGPARRAGRRPTSDGFTLIEMLAALALAMILLYMLFQIFGQATRTMTLANARSEINANARYILRLMHQEISGAFLDTSQDADGDDDADYLVITDGTAPWGDDADYLQFLTSSAVGKSGALSEVGYWLDTDDAKNPILRRRLASDPTNYDSDPLTDGVDNDDDGTTDEPDEALFHASNRVLDMNNDGDFEDTNELPTSPDAKDATILGENVLGFNVEYYDVSINTFSGGNYTAQERALTPALRITLKVRDSKGRLAEGEEFMEIIAIKWKE